MSALSRKLLKSLASITYGWLADESSDVESTYVAKPRYYHKRKSRKLDRCLAYITADLQRLTSFTLIVVLICGLATVALLSLLRLPVDQRVIINAPAPDDSSLNPQSDLQSNKQDQHEPSSRLPVVKPLAKSSERVDAPHQKEAITPKRETTTERETQADRRLAQSVKSARVLDKRTSSTNVVRADKAGASRAKAVPSPVATKPSSANTQRPRRVTVKNDRSVPVATSGRNNKAKVIQWP